MTPKVSFLLLSYNQQETAAEAAAHALAQDYPNLEIIISDDCSPDRTFERLSKVCGAYRGTHAVKLIQTAENAGLLGNLIHALHFSTGELAVIAAADDLSSPTRASELAKAWLDAGRPPSAVVYSDVRPIDRQGLALDDWPERVVRPPFTLERLAEGATGPLGATCAITPNLIREPQPIDPGVRHEDRVFPFRALLLGGPILFVDKPLVDYRVEGGISRREVASRWQYLTEFTADYIPRVLPDARQRLSDAIAANAPPQVIKRCEQTLAEQRAFLAMSNGKNLIAKGLRAMSSGARATVIATHLLRFARAAASR